MSHIVTDEGEGNILATTYSCIDCPELEGATRSEGKYHAQYNNHCVVADDDD